MPKVDGENIFALTGWSMEQLAAHLSKTGRGVRMLIAICDAMGIQASFKGEAPYGLEFVHEHRWVQKVADTYRQCIGCGVREHLCTICDQPITGGTMVGDGDGKMTNGGRFAHQDCYNAREEHCND